MAITKNAYLTLEEMTENAQFILDYFTNLGWTKNAVCGMLGNMQTESTINSGIWENLDENNMTGGFGLVQWTPATKYTNYADEHSYPWILIDGQCERIEYERINGLQYYATESYPLSFTEFSQSTESLDYLAQAFLYNYERPAVTPQPLRGTQAQYWFDNLTGGDVPPDPDPVVVKKKHLPIWMYNRLF